jgi:hypothetical protein
LLPYQKVDETPRRSHALTQAGKPYTTGWILIGQVSRDMHVGEARALYALDLQWEGPFGWPGLEPGGQVMSLAASTVASSSGIYLWTVEHLDGFLIYAAGITRRPFVKRFREHTRAYRAGEYTLFDMASLKQGVRKEVWHGFWSKKRTLEKLSEYAIRRQELRMAVEEQLSSYRVFVASAGPAPRLLERIEASIMYALYEAPAPACDIPDRGMALAPRWRTEQSILVRNVTCSRLHALPTELEV